MGLEWLESQFRNGGSEFATSAGDSFQPTVDFAAGQLPASLLSGVRVWGSLENSQAHRRAGMDPESDHVGQVTERSPRETERRLRMETQHDHVSVHRGSPK